MFLSNSLFSNFYGRHVYLGCFGPKQKTCCTIWSVCKSFVRLLASKFLTQHVISLSCISFELTV